MDDCAEAHGRSRRSDAQCFPDLIAIAQRNPEVIIELKSLVADLAQAKGIPSQADGITDEQLFSQICQQRRAAHKHHSFA
jgi:hypothetical protein